MSLQGLTRSELDRAETQDFALGGKLLRPRDAATLILLDRDGGAVRVLMGKRHRKHAFMPGKFVFPGGRTDPDDARVAVASSIDPAEEPRIMGARASRARARAIAMSAIRETYEEAGLLLGRRAPFRTGNAKWQAFAGYGVQPSLDGLRFVARAITPPGRVRRFDTRFLAARRGDVAVALPGGGPTGELEELCWLTFAEAGSADIPVITRTILGDLEQRLAVDPDLAPGGPAPFYFMRARRMCRELV